MLTLQRFHLVLRRVQHEDIEMIRRGRNSEAVRMQHVYREEITPAEQEAWFTKINRAESYFFTIGSHDRKVGVVYVADFTPKMATSNCGVFLWDKEALGSRVPILAILTVLDFFFGDLRGGSTESFVLRSNTAAMKMNDFFGFAFEEIPERDGYRISMDLERYLANRDRLLRFAHRMIKDESARALKLTGERSPLNFPEINRLLPEGSA